jgi:hypothetical protein
MEIMEKCPTSWVIEQELLLKDWAEKARYYSWMHNKAGNMYVRRNNKITIPLIIISTVSGSANFSMVGVHTPYNWIYTVGFPLVMGMLSITAAILSAMAKYLRTAELSENHHEFHKKYNSLFRNISLELSLPANQRKAPAEICNMHRYELDRLVSEAPNIPEVIINAFNAQFPFVKNKPEITHSFDKVVIYGRNEALRSNFEKFSKIRNFYKFVYSIRLAKTSGQSFKGPKSSDIESNSSELVTNDESPTSIVNISIPSNQIDDDTNDRREGTFKSRLYDIAISKNTTNKPKKSQTYSNCVIM